MTNSMTRPRPILPDDFANVVALENRLFDDAWQMADLQALFNHHQATGFGILGVYITKNNREYLASYLIYQCLDVGEVLRIGTHPDKQGQGLAKQLLSYWLDTLNKQKINCLLEVQAGNTPAIALYQHLGFHTIHRRKNYYKTKNGTVDALIMQWQAD